MDEYVVFLHTPGDDDREYLTTDGITEELELAPRYNATEAMRLAARHNTQPGRVATACVLNLTTQQVTVPHRVPMARIGRQSRHSGFQPITASMYTITRLILPECEIERYLHLERLSCQTEARYLNFKKWHLTLLSLSLLCPVLILVINVNLQGVPNVPSSLMFVAGLLWQWLAQEVLSARRERLRKEAHNAQVCQDQYVHQLRRKFPVYEEGQ